MAENDVAVELDSENGTVIIRGKTNVPFRTFVSLILQRKIQSLVKQWKDEPLMVSSELLTSLASAPDDKQEDRAKLVVVTLMTGVYLGALITTAAFLLLSLMNVYPQATELAIVCGLLVAFAVLVFLMQKLQRARARSQSLLERMERLTELLTK